MFVCKLIRGTYKSVVLLTYPFPFLWFLIEIPTALPRRGNAEYRSFTSTFQLRPEASEAPVGITQPIDSGVSLGL